MIKQLTVQEHTLFQVVYNSILYLFNISMNTHKINIHTNNPEKGVSIRKHKMNAEMQNNCHFGSSLISFSGYLTFHTNKTQLFRKLTTSVVPLYTYLWAIHDVHQYWSVENLFTVNSYPEIILNCCLLFKRNLSLALFVHIKLGVLCSKTCWNLV